MPNWTAMRWKFKRSRRAQLLAGLAAFVVLFVLNSLVASWLRPDPTPPADPGAGTAPVATSRIDVPPAVVKWQEGDYWVWEDGYGLRIVDRVEAVSYVGNGSSRVALYHVQRTSSAADGANPRVDNITYDSRTLSVRSVESRSYTIDWRQRTLGLTFFSQNGGFISNATVKYASGREAHIYRVANVTDAATARISVPAGRFDDVRAAEIQLYEVDLRDPESGRILTWSHWFSPTVANDVRFTLPNGTMMRLVGYRANGGFVPAPEPPVTPRWRVGQTWTYDDGAGTERTVDVVAAKDGVLTVRTRTPLDTTTITDTARYRASDLALLDYTLHTVPFRLEPHGVPFVPENGTHEYAKYVRAAGPERRFEGNATVTVRPGAVIGTPVGDLEARRIDIVERERGPDGLVASFRTVRFFAPYAANDARIVDVDGVMWTLQRFDLGPRPLRGDVLPPP